MCAWEIMLLLKKIEESFAGLWQRGWVAGRGNEALWTWESGSVRHQWSGLEAVVVSGLSGVGTGAVAVRAGGGPELGGW